MSNLDAVRARFACNEGLPFADILAETSIREVLREHSVPYRDRVFNPVTTIEFSVPSRTDVTIEVFNVLGQKVRTLVNETRAAGSYRIEWNGNDDAGNSVSTGVYLYRFQAGDVMQTKKMLLIK